MTATVRFVGSGDSFGSGGRFQTCIMVDAAGGTRFTMDFGTSSLIALRQPGHRSELHRRRSSSPTCTETTAAGCRSCWWTRCSGRQARAAPDRGRAEGPPLPHVHDLGGALPRHARDEAEVRARLDRARAGRADPGGGHPGHRPLGEAHVADQPDRAARRDRGQGDLLHRRRRVRRGDGARGAGAPTCWCRSATSTRSRCAGT